MVEKKVEKKLGKQHYLQPEVDVIAFEATDIIATSGCEQEGCPAGIVGSLDATGMSKQAFKNSLPKY